LQVKRRKIVTLKNLNTGNDLSGNTTHYRET